MKSLEPPVADKQPQPLKSDAYTAARTGEKNAQACKYRSDAFQRGAVVWQRIVAAGNANKREDARDPPDAPEEGQHTKEVLFRKRTGSRHLDTRAGRESRIWRFIYVYPLCRFNSNFEPPMAANGYQPNGVARPLRPGIYAPIPSFFLPESEDLGLSAAVYASSRLDSSPYQTYLLLKRMWYASPPQESDLSLLVPWEKPFICPTPKG